ncbi:zinc ion binding protein [Rhynchospora pubera]|uniref:Zinc ion binding protein n=1 Tax=Rhynchospora pubera TaxID=906938 RepID=A0AAV8HBA0_9POAL|nr:zinc ion binding protein [Rhynchospora pubera]
MELERTMQGKDSLLSPALCRSIFSQIEEIGWEHLIKATEDLASLTFRILDEKGKCHVAEIILSHNYPHAPPSINADLPSIPKLKWSNTSRLIDVINQLREHLKKLQEVWSTLECIDNNLSVIGRKEQGFATTHRHISLCEDCSILLHINPCRPNSLPECRFFGSDEKVDQLLKNWKKNSRNWKSDKSFHENLATILETELPEPPISATTATENRDEAIDCGICYVTYLPIDEELGSDSGCAPDYKCENTSCMRAFHTVCLRDWLRTITTTRQSFDVLFGNCPYCSEPVAVKICD